MHNIQAYFGKFSFIDVFQKFWPWVNFSRSRSKIKVKVIFGVAFHKLKYEPSLKSVTARCEVIANLVNLTFCSTLTLTFDANNRLCPVCNIQAYFGKFSLIDVPKILTLGELFKVKVKSQGHIWCGFSCTKIWTKFKVTVTIRCEVISN